MFQDSRCSFLDLGLLILRLGIGSMFIFHGWGKISGGMSVWEGLGKTMSIFGINFAPAFWGFMAAFAEFFGGIFIILGVFFQVFCALITIVMIVAITMHLSKGDGLTKAAEAVEMGILFFSLILIGPGKCIITNAIKCCFGK